jgi:RimJ/RimL family protein N-acetyltransferase
MKLVPLNLKKPGELAWLHRFIMKYHSSPRRVLPSRRDLLNPSYRFFRAVAGKGGKTVLGITSYEIRTPFLVETQKTIVAPEHRGRGWGPQISEAIEQEVRRKGFRKIRSTIYTDNLTMIAIKLAQGFRIEGFHPDHDAPGLDEYSLGKILR